ncbi:thioredoxin 1 [Microcystis aeruginosa NIES-2520]|uniref:Thioredoxin 1 n=3 Tax=Microcystaceae TaxID=1890449 RepID=A0A5A5RLL2_MICAE|nr:thioredoxin 1 [Microcystis aeruginosa NIES-2520]CCI29972.1 Similar to tr/A0YMR0/A0YMR0_9CYAN Thioredoxin [Microcystis aeruginosa PCC 9809]
MVFISKLSFHKIRLDMMLSVNEKSFPKLVLDSSGPVLVHFWAPWCGLCRLIQPTLLSWQNDCQGAIQLVAVNADDNFKLANSFRLRSLPTLILFDRGVPVHRLEEIHSREELHQTLRLIVKNQILRSA